ncbi:MAG: PilZ domain-containing protein [Acidobacteriota bacterium]|nr:PilZ domain-containing protein [Acidobacteriota bacterium]MDH3785014.1 PilZ domain-containing protein [Acidobacteriota bacterium]
MEWCKLCGAAHGTEVVCPVGLEPIEIERHTWRVNTDTPDGIVAIGVLLAPCDAGWRARILTYPNVLWLAPEGTVSLKFHGMDAKTTERQAIDFVRRHCRSKLWEMRDEVAVVHAEPLQAESGIETARVGGVPAPRRVRFLPVRYGVAAINEAAGTGDLSETGIFVITDRPATCGTRLNLALDLDEGSVDLQGVVRWGRAQHRVGRAPGMGIQLEDPPSAYLTYVRRLE